MTLCIVSFRKHASKEEISVAEEKEYKVVWEMELMASSPLEAAEKALEIHRNPESIAIQFFVDGESIDLLNESDS